MPLLISELLEPKQIDLHLAGTTQAEAIREVVNLCKGNRHVRDLEGFQRAILQRERVQSTVADQGVAFPHARTDLIDRIVIAVGRSKTGVRFEGVKEPVHLVFAIGTPKTMVTDYLICVGALARSLHNPEVREKLLRAKDPAEFIRILSAFT